MSARHIQNDTPVANAEPLLPVEKKLIGFSLGIGLALLVVLVAINHLFPVKF
jgi:heme/copper-type cytochrome/quinol oxidase subunit 4